MTGWLPRRLAKDEAERGAAAVRSMALILLLLLALPLTASAAPSPASNGSGVHVSIVGPDTQDIPRGGFRVFSYTVENNGSANESFSLSVVPDVPLNSSWTFILSSNRTPELLPLGIAGVELTVGALSGAQRGESVNLTLAATGVQNASARDSATVRANTYWRAQESLGVDSPTKVAGSGESVVFSFYTHNTGTENDTVDLSVGAPPAGWTAQLNTSTLFVSSGGTAVFRLTVTSPSNAVASTTTCMRVTAASRIDLVGGDDQQVCVLIKIQFELALTPLITSAQAPPGNFTVLPLSASLASNTPNSSLVTFTTYSVMPPGWSATADPPYANLSGGQTAIINLTVFVATGAVVGDGAVITVVASSAEYPGEASTLVYVSTAAVHSISVRGLSSTPTNDTGIAALWVEITETGTVTDQVTVGLLGLPAGWTWTFMFDSAATNVVTTEPQQPLAGAFLVAVDPSAHAGSYNVSGQFGDSAGNIVFVDLVVSVSARHGLAAYAPVGHADLTVGETASLYIVVNNTGNTEAEISLAVSSSSLLNITTGTTVRLLLDAADFASDLVGTPQWSLLFPPASSARWRLDFTAGSELRRGDTVLVVTAQGAQRSDSVLLTFTLHLPDLEVSALIIDPPATSLGTTVKATVNISNIGDWTAINFTVLITLDGKLLRNITVPRLGPGNTASFVAVFNATEGTHTVRAVVDPGDGGAVVEASESNNARESSLVVLAPAAPVEAGGSSVLALLAVVVVVIIGAIAYYIRLERKDRPPEI